MKLKTVVLFFLILVCINNVHAEKESLKDSFKINETETYVYDSIKDKEIKTKIGNTLDGNPYILIDKWNEDSLFYILFDDPTPEKPKKTNGDEKTDKKLDKDGLKWTIKNDNVLTVIPIDENYYDGIEFNLTLFKIPTTNKFIFNIKDSNLHYHYQPFSHPTNCIVPDNVKGSYAVYHNSKKDGIYKTGKVFHIYRPKIIDYDGNWIWGVLKIEQDPVKDSYLSITIDQTWLDNAKYPVVIDPIFGYDSIGASTMLVTDEIISSRISNSFSVYGNVNNVSAYVTQYDTATPTMEFNVYDQDESPISTTGTETKVFASTGWQTLNYSTAPNLTVLNSYYPVIWFDDNAYLHYDVSTNRTIIDHSKVYDGSWPDPTSTIINTYSYSIYASYTEYTPDEDPYIHLYPGVIFDLNPTQYFINNTLNLTNISIFDYNLSFDNANLTAYPTTGYMNLTLDNITSTELNLTNNITMSNITVVNGFANFTVTNGLNYGIYFRENNSLYQQDTASNNETTFISIPSSAWTIKEAEGETTIDLLSVFPSVISQNSTGWCNISLGITHSNAGLNNSSVSFIYNVYDVDNDIIHYSVRPPGNNVSTSIPAIYNESLFRGANRNQTLNFESNDTITGGDIYTWGGFDENSTRLSIEPINSTYSIVHVNSSLFGLVLSDTGWYLDRTEMLVSSKTAMPIHKNNGVLFKYWNIIDHRGFHDYIGTGMLQTLTSEIEPTAPIELYFLNDSYDPTTGVNPLEYPYILFSGSLDYEGWTTWTHYEQGVPYVHSYVDNELLNYFIESGDVAYIYLISSTDSNKPYYFAATDDDTTTNVSFADTGTMWSVNPGGAITSEPYTANYWSGAFFDNSTFQFRLYAADNNGVWGDSTQQNISIETGDILPTQPLVHAIYDDGVMYENNGDITNAEFDGTIIIGVGPSFDPDGGNVSHNLTLHYENGTLSTIINNTFTDADLTNCHINLSFDTIPFYLEDIKYNLRINATDNENNTVTVWLNRYFYLGPQPTPPDLMPKSFFIVASLFMFACAGLSFILPGYTKLITNMFAIMLSYSLSQKIINSKVVTFFGHINTADVIDIEYRTMEIPFISYIYLFVGIIMVLVFIINITNTIRNTYEEKTEVDAYE